MKKLPCQTDRVMKVRLECAMQEACWVCWSWTAHGDTTLEVRVQEIEIAG